MLTCKLSLGCLFSPHHVNQGGVQKTTPQVTLYKPHTVKESLRRRKPGKHSQVLTVLVVSFTSRTVVIRLSFTSRTENSVCLLFDFSKGFLQARAWPETTQSQISHPHPGSSWSFCLFQPLSPADSLLDTPKNTSLRSREKKRLLKLPQKKKWSGDPSVA